MANESLRIYNKRLYQQGKFLGLVVCQHCGERGGLWQAWDPSWAGWTRYCMLCSWKEPFERAVEAEARASLVRANENRLREIKRMIRAKEVSRPSGGKTC